MAPKRKLDQNNDSGGEGSSTQAKRHKLLELSAAGLDSKNNPPPPHSPSVLAGRRGHIKKGKGNYSSGSSTAQIEKASFGEESDQSPIGSSNEVPASLSAKPKPQVGGGLAPPQGYSPGRKEKYTNPSDNSSSSNSETRVLGEANPRSGIHSKGQRAIPLPAKRNSQNKATKSFHDFAKSSPNRPGGRRVKSNDLSQSPSHDRQIPPLGKRKRHRPSEADSGSEDALSPPARKKTLSGSPAKGSHSLGKSGPSHANYKAKGTNKLNETSPGDPKIGPPAKGEKRQAKKPDSKNQDAASLAAEQNERDTRRIEGHHDSTKNVQSGARGEGKRASNLDQSSSPDMKIAPPRKRKRFLPNWVDSEDEDAVSLPATKMVLDWRLAKGLTHSGRGGAGHANYTAEEANDLSESCPHDSQTTSPAKREKHPANEPNSKSQDVVPFPTKEDTRPIKGLRDSKGSPSYARGEGRKPNVQYYNRGFTIGPPGKLSKLLTSPTNSGCESEVLFATRLGEKQDRAIKGALGYAQWDNCGMDDPKIQYTGSVKSQSKPYNYFDSLVEPPRKIYLPPDRYAEYVAKLRKEQLYKEFTTGPNAWEKRTWKQRGPRAGRSDEFETEEEAKYAENIVREATRRRLETYHRERHEMWGLKKVQRLERTYKDMESSEEEDLEVEGSEDGDSEGHAEQEDPEPEVQVIQKDQTEDATVEDILKGLPKPLDPCFNSPADIIFLPPVPKFNEVVFQLEYHRGYTRKQVLWLMGGAREGRDPIPSANAVGMRLKRYMKKNNLTDTVKVTPASTVAKKSTPKSDNDDEDENLDNQVHSTAHERPLLPHGPRIKSKELGVHSWFWDHPHEIY